MTAERMFKEYKNLKKEQGILLFQLEQFSGIEESDVIDSMMFGHADDNDRVQTSNRSDKKMCIRDRSKAGRKYCTGSKQGYFSGSDASLGKGRI